MAVTVEPMRANRGETFSQMRRPAPSRFTQAIPEPTARSPSRTIKRPATILGVELYSTTDEAFLFETGGQIGAVSPGRTAELNVEYDDIPLRIRNDIERGLRDGGFTVDDDVVVEEYERQMRERYGIGAVSATQPPPMISNAARNPGR